MAASLSMDLRKRAVMAVDRGLSRRQAAIRFNVSAASVIRWCQRRTQTGALSAHKQGGDRKTGRIEAHAAFILAGASLLYLPPYSPDFNPIEMAFSTFKAHLRAAAPRTIPALNEAIASAIERFKPSECRAYFEAAGYDAM